MGVDQLHLRQRLAELRPQAADVDVDRTVVAARLGFVTELLSKPIRYGYMNGVALTVLISQLPKLFGFSIDSTGPLRDLLAIGKAIWQGGVNWIELALGLVALTIILLLKADKRIPAILIAVVAATAIAGSLDLAETAAVGNRGAVCCLSAGPGPALAGDREPRFHLLRRVVPQEGRRGTD